MIITPKPITVNYSKGRSGYTPKAIVMHVMVGTLYGCDSWFANPAAKVSAHFGVGGTTKREVHQYVDALDTAWHAGANANGTWDFLGLPKSSPNLYTIGIEMEGKSGPTIDPATIDEAATLVATLCIKHYIPVDRRYIIGHCEINQVSRKDCPGVDLDAFVHLVYVKYLSLLKDKEPVPTPIPEPTYIVEVTKGADQTTVYEGTNENTAHTTYEAEVRPGIVDLSKDEMIVKSKINIAPPVEEPVVIPPPKDEFNLVQYLINLISHIFKR